MSDEQPPQRGLPSGGPSYNPEGETPTQEVVEAVNQQAFQLMLQQLIDMALPFAPPNFDAEKQLGAMAMVLLNEQQQYIQTVIPAMMRPQEGFPEVEMYVWRAGTGPESKKTPDLRIVEDDGLSGQQVAPDFSGADPAVLDCPKRLEGVDDPMTAMKQGLCYAFITNPAARAVLRMNGWLYYFTQVKKEA